MKLTILGSGSPEAHVRRASSGYLIEAGEDTILLDCGGGVYDNLLRSGRLPSDVTHLFFSHLHSDHMMDYARLVHGAWDESAAPLKVFGPPPISRITEGYFGKDGVLAHDLVARTEHPGSQHVWVARGGSLPRPWPTPEVEEVEPGFSYDGKGWRLTSCEALHAQPFLTCMGFAIESDGRKFVYSGDAGLTDELAALAGGADLLLHWCYRLDGEESHPSIVNISPTPSDTGRMAKDAGVKRLLLTHFRKHMDEPDRHAGALAAVRKAFGDDCGVAEDLETYDI